MQPWFVKFYYLCFGQQVSLFRFVRLPWLSCNIHLIEFDSRNMAQEGQLFTEQQLNAVLAQGDVAYVMAYVSSTNMSI
jgi:hypothetical protein